MAQENARIAADISARDGQVDVHHHMTTNTTWDDTKEKHVHQHEYVISPGERGMRNAVLLSVLLLSACANFPQAVGANGAVQESRQSDAAPQPAAPQKSAPVEAQQPAPSGQGDNLPQKPKHNVEED